ncbi:MAG: hypothetical protein IT372_33430 [Polyangiaceae bacterium]|nr:hypothetical protein [Polyangiaceae bacterium]
MDPGELDILRPIIHGRYFDIYRRAWDRSRSLLDECSRIVDEHLRDAGLPAERICFVAVGSVGRHEALHASDLDLVPVLAEGVPAFAEHDRAIRRTVSERLRVKVSRGEDLTSATLLGDLVRSESIGGDDDASPALTKRILILSEGAQAGGALPIGAVRSALLAAYADAERTSGRHVLSLCNDFARYYRTLCIEYKSKIDNEDKDWCTRNMKLRHSRKLWYFATMLAIAAIAGSTTHADRAYRDAILGALSVAPCARLASALPAPRRDALRQLLESYAWFLEFMGHAENRQALASVPHEDRYAARVDNPFPAMKHNSDLIHREMIGILETLDRPMRHRVLDWFLL